MKPLKNILLLLLLLASCGSSERGRMLAVLDEADSLNRNYIPFTTDSVLKEATEWFDSYGSANERMRAHYLLGCAYRDMGEAPAALQCYHDAINCADTTATDCDYRLLCRVYSQIAYVFHEQYMPNSELRMLDNAIKYAYLSGDTLLALNCQENKIGSYYQLNNNDSVIAISWEMNRKYKEAGNIKRSSLCLGTALFLVLRQGHYEDTKKVLTEYTRHSDIFRQNGEVLPGYELLYYVKGMYFLGTNQLDSSKYYLNKMFKNKLDINSTKAAYEGLYKYYAHIHQYDSAAKYSELYTALNDSSYMRMTTNQLAHLQCMYDYTRHQQLALEKSEEVSKFKSILFVVIFCVICVLYCTISIIRKYNRERREMEKQHKSDVQELLLLKNEIEKLSTANLPLIIEEKTKRIHELQSKIDEYQTKNYKKLNDVNLRLTKSEIYKHFRDYCLAPHKSEITVEDWDTLVGLLNNEVPTFFQLLTVNTQSLRKLDIYLCILVRLRFQPKDISIILDISQSEVSVLRRRLLKKIFNCDGSAKDFDKKIQSISD